MICDHEVIRQEKLDGSYSTPFCKKCGKVKYFFQKNPDIGNVRISAKNREDADLRNPRKSSPSETDQVHTIVRQDV
jgi:hypothetical protein